MKLLIDNIVSIVNSIDRGLYHELDHTKQHAHITPDEYKEVHICTEIIERELFFKDKILL